MRSMYDFGMSDDEFPDVQVACANIHFYLVDNLKLYT